MKPEVLVATDLSEASDEAVRQAHGLAAGGPLSAVYVIPRLATTGLDPLFPPAALQATLDTPDLEVRARAAVTERIRALTHRENVPVEVRLGIPEDEIVAVGPDVGTIVVGSHGRTGLARMLLGSVAEKVARHAKCDVLVARAPHSESPVVVVATDLTEASDAAFQAAIREATRRSARLFAVHSIEDPHVAAYSELAAAFGLSSLGPPPEFERDVREALGSMIAKRLAHSQVIAESVVASGPPASAIVRLAEQVHASLVVIGSGKKTTLERVALGSVAEKIVRHAPCSVLLARQLSA